MRWDVKRILEKKEDLLDILLEIRGVLPEEKETFLNPPKPAFWIKNLDEDFKESLRKAKAKVFENIKNNIPIIIYGDYDSDGICATYVIYKTIKEELGYSKVSYFIPNRFEHGYGLSKKALDACKEIYPDEKPLIITVDTGITGVEEAKYAKDLGFDLIITDHHQKPEVLPEADIIVWNDAVVGASVSWILSTVLGAKDENLIVYPGIATITDLQAVRNFNRTFVKEALYILNKEPPLGIKNIIKVAGKNNKAINTYDIGFMIGPRLNASGRIKDATQALELLLEENEDKSFELANKLNDVNIDRQEKTLEMYDFAKVADENNLPKLIISSHENYHEGIIGLVASKLVQKYFRPAIVISTSPEIDYAKGSVRSVSGINIIEFLRKFEDQFLSLGGHPGAAGFSIKREKVSDIEKLLTEEAEKSFDEALFVPSVDVDLEILPSFLDIDFVEKLKLLEPFGLGNKQPNFAVRNLAVSQMSKVGKDQNHMSFRFFDGQNFIKGICFNFQPEVEKITIKDNVDVVCTLTVDEYNGKKTVNLIINDIKRH